MPSISINQHRHLPASNYTDGTTHTSFCISVETSVVLSFVPLLEHPAIDFVHIIPCGAQPSLELPCGDVLFLPFPFVICLHKVANMKALLQLSTPPVFPVLPLSDQGCHTLTNLRCCSPSAPLDGPPDDGIAPACHPLQLLPIQLVKSHGRAMLP